MVDAFDDFGDFLTLTVEEFIRGKDARGYFKSAGVSINNDDDKCDINAGEEN